MLGLIQYGFSAEGSRGDYPLSGKHSQMRPLKRVFPWSQVLMSTKIVNLSSHLFYRSGNLARRQMTQYFEDDPYDAQVLFSDTAFNLNQSCQDLAPHKYRKAMGIDTSGLLVGNGFDLGVLQYAR